MEVAVAEIDKFLKIGRQVGASDIHIAVGSSPLLRLHGALRRIKYPPFTPEQTKKLFYEIMSDRQRRKQNLRAFERDIRAVCANCVPLGYPTGSIPSKTESKLCSG